MIGDYKNAHVEVDWSRSMAMQGKVGGIGSLNHKKEIIRQFQLKYPGVSVSRQNWKTCASLANGSKTYSGDYIRASAVAASVKGYKNAEEGVGFVNMFAGGLTSALEFCTTFFSEQLPLLNKIATICEENNIVPYEAILAMNVEDAMPFGTAWNLVGDVHDEMYGGNFSGVIDGSGVELLHLLATIKFDPGKFSDRADDEDVMNAYRTMGSKGLSSLVMRQVLSLLVQKKVGRVVTLSDSDTKKPVRDVAIPVSPNFT